MTATVRTSIIIVSYNGKKYLEPCLSALRPQLGEGDEVLVVDNASSDGSADFIADSFPWVRLIRSPRNLGFAGGNNLGMREARGEYLVLLNNDTEVEPRWLSSLVDAAEADPEAGAVGSKLLFYGKFIPVTFSCDAHVPYRRGTSTDLRTLGFRLSSDLAFEGTSYRKSFFECGFYPEESEAGGSLFRWSQGLSRVLLPCRLEGGPATLVLTAAAGAGASGREVSVLVGGREAATLSLGSDFREYRVAIDGAMAADAAVDVINNAGSFLGYRTRSGDIGFGEIDRGQFDQPGEKDNLCGGSVLLRRRMLDDIGDFDERLFMYYEDTDLFWRARKRGWKLLYAPQSVVRHVHAGSSQEWSPFFCFHAFRNRFLVTVKNGSWGEIAYNGAVLVHPLYLHLSGALRALLKAGRPDAAFLPGIKLHLRIVGSALSQTTSFLFSRFGGR